MSEHSLKVSQQIMRAHRVRAKLHGTAERPRLSVNISNRHISAQVIDDDTGTTLAAVSTTPKDAGTMTEKAANIGTQIAKAATAKKVKQVVLDRGAKLYHGRVKALAEAARAAGLEF